MTEAERTRTRMPWVIAVGGGVVLAMLAFVVLRWSPAIPADAAAAPIATTVLSGDIAPDAVAGQDINQIPPSPWGHECLTRIERSTGYFDVCWSAHRVPADSDPTKDYYLLSMFGTFGAGRDGSPRWAVLRADLEGTPADGVMVSWPAGEFDGSCAPESVSMEFVPPETQEILCGHIRATDVEPWGRTVSWTCEGCILPDDHDRSLVLYVGVGVPPGAIPTWQLFADLGD